MDMTEKRCAGGLLRSGCAVPAVRYRDAPDVLKRGGKLRLRVHLHLGGGDAARQKTRGGLIAPAEFWT